MKIPWVHDNVEADEVLFYVRGNFDRAAGSNLRSITLHPRGIPHGPHPGTIMASKNAQRTEELAVMFDTQHTLELDQNRLWLSTTRNIRLAGWTRVNPSDNGETELQAAGAAYSKFCRSRGAAKLARDGVIRFRNFLGSTGEDPQREGLLRTPTRAARAFEFLTNGYRQNLDDIVNGAIFSSEASEISILVKDIELYSMCEHHLLPFIGRAHVAASEWESHLAFPNRAHCRCFRTAAANSGAAHGSNCGRADEMLGAQWWCGVVVEAKHLCMMMRGVEKQNSVMKTSCLLGSFKEDARTRSRVPRAAERVSCSVRCPQRIICPYCARERAQHVCTIATWYVL